MCGIAGVVETGGGAADEALLERMSALIAHRGPDASGTVVEGAVGLAHRRLAIIDLSDEGCQPMTSGDGALTIVFNGEVFNYLELREELRAAGHAFRTGTDTEVVLAAYAAWGRDCLARFNGMWAFAILDRRRGEVFLARDRLGVKPLYYALARRPLPLRLGVQGPARRSRRRDEPRASPRSPRSSPGASSTTRRSPCSRGCSSSRPATGWRSGRAGSRGRSAGGTSP